MAGPGLVTLTVIVTSSPFFTGFGLAVWLTARSAEALAGSARAMATAATPMPRLDTLATVPRRRPKGQEISADPAEHLTELGVDPGAPVAMPVT